MDATLEHLSEIPTQFQELHTYIESIDSLLLVGTGHAKPSDIDIFRTLAEAVPSKSLQNRVHALVRAFDENLLNDEAYETIALVRSTLQIAQYEILQHYLTTILGRASIISDDTFSSLQTQGSENGILNAVKKWLIEIAIAGFDGLSADAMTPFIPTLEKLVSIPELNETHAILLGFINEIMDYQPIHNIDMIPQHRWADLWSRLMMRTLSPKIQVDCKSVSGDLFLLGLEIQQHTQFVSVILYGLLKAEEDLHSVRIVRSSFKVDVIDTSHIWLLFPELKPLITALSSAQSLKIENGQLSPGGDLTISYSHLKSGKSFNLIEMMSSCYSIESPTNNSTPLTLPAFYRHPIHVSEMIFTDTFQIKGTGTSHIKIGEVSIPLLIPGTFPELDTKTLKTSKWIFGAFRYDNTCWWFQPFSLGKSDQIASEPIFPGYNFIDTFEGKSRYNPVKILKERASRLLRSK
ncbi:MAG: hypothetical protein BAJATHORv1_10560 [Candidatus Thorarchaeota archaeon]|nr:MAG: hypothetical protein BAJATHORv1_10560 [Candidatus Thorarchaeota archaeon]